MLNDESVSERGGLLPEWLERAGLCLRGFGLRERSRCLFGSELHIGESDLALEVGIGFAGRCEVGTGFVERCETKSVRETGSEDCQIGIM